MPGLRENFNPRARWRSAINSTRAIIRLNAGLNAAKLNGANASRVKPEIPSDDEDDDDEVFPLPTSRKSNTSTSKLLAGETGPELNTEPIPPLPSSSAEQPPVEEKREKELSEPPSTPKNPPQPPHPPQPLQVEQITEDTSRMSIQTDDMPMPGSFFRKQHVVQGDGDEHHNVPRWLQKWFHSKKG